MNHDNYYPFETTPLPYSIDALKPYISEYTLYFHHDKHYKGYVDKLNALLKKSPTMQNVPLEALTKMSDKDVSTNAGGVYNHELYFSSLTPDYKEPSEKMSELIQSSFGSEKEMWNELVSAGMDLTGSGFVWLAVNPNGELEVVVTKNQDTPDLDKFSPLLNIDVWEHAYYLDRQNLRRDYLTAVQNIINWENAEKMLNASSDRISG
ncbi:MAG: superoxide dismutase [Oscillospiraceae bacterium]|nr:superoxide dismutase [Oscillospiraceae bacterium]